MKRAGGEPQAEDKKGRRLRGGILAFLAAASPGLLFALLVEATWTLGLFALLAAAFPVALMALGAARRGRLGPLAGLFALLLLLLEAGLGALLFLRGRGVDGPWIGGLPPAAAVQLYGLALVPLVLVVLTYAFTFDRWGLAAEDLERLRRRAGERGKR